MLMASSGRDPDDDGLGAAQPAHPGDVAQRSGAEGVEHVERGDVDDHAAGPLGADPLDEVALEAHQLAVVQCRVDGRDEVGALR